MSSSYLPDNVVECFIITCFAGGDEGEIIERFKVIPESVGQYIRMKDKKKTEIYEGDILEKRNVFTESFYRVTQYTIKSITTRFLAGKWVLYDGDKKKSKTILSEKNEARTCEVIGNIYEHSHLLERLLN